MYKHLQMIKEYYSTQHSRSPPGSLAMKPQDVEVSASQTHSQLIQAAAASRAPSHTASYTFGQSAF